MYRIYIVEDDPVIAGAVERHMESWGLQARCAQDFSQVLAEFADFDPHLVLMDISLPRFDGYHWCAQIRKLSSVPVVFLSSASDNMNIVMAMNMGGDDFIAKPFDLNVLMAKVQALLRRAYDFAGQAPLLEHRGAFLNAAEASLSYQGRKIPLSRNECRILLTLMRAKGAVVSRETLMQRLWETDEFVDENTLTVNVTRLRRKLEGAGLKNFIETKKGMGYQLGAREEAQ